VISFCFQLISGTRLQRRRTVWARSSETTSLPLQWNSLPYFSRLPLLRIHLPHLGLVTTDDRSLLEHRDPFSDRLRAVPPSLGLRSFGRANFSKRGNLQVLGLRNRAILCWPIIFQMTLCLRFGMLRTAKVEMTLSRLADSRCRFSWIPPRSFDCCFYNTRPGRCTAFGPESYLYGFSRFWEAPSLLQICHQLNYNYSAVIPCSLTRVRLE